MPSPKFSDPPNKRRKITKTYGSSSIFTRALQAVQDVVPGKLLSLSNGAHNRSTNAVDKVTELKSKPQLPDSGYNVDTSAVQSPQSMTANARSDDKNPSEDSQLVGRGRSVNTNGRGKPRASKRIQRNTIATDTAETPPWKKRRKLQDGARSGQENGSQLSDEEARTTAKADDFTAAASGGRKSLPTAIQLDGTVTGEDDTVNGDIGQQANSQHPSGRSLRRTGRFSLLKSQLPTPSSPTKTMSTPKTPVSTPGRKRGRPRKHPIESTIPPEEEENQLGFHKITPNGDTSVQEQDDKTPRSTRRARISSEQVALGTTKAKVRSIRNDTKDTSPVQFALPETQREEVPYHDEQQGIQKVSKRLETTTLELRQVLEATSPASLHDLKFDILAALTGRRTSLSNMEEEYYKVHQLVAQTVLAGEGNSMLVIGPRGCGKTKLVESVLSDLGMEHRDSFMVIRLNGFIHTDDKIALREIWRQLGREVAGEEETTGSRINVADALTSLLALLAHSPEDDEKEDEIARSVVFVIDEFDLFASHPRQTLLYNLFDVAQSRNAPIAVLGLTTRIDIIESLEKRVKSRFGQRYVYLTHPRTPKTFQEICKAALSGQGASTKPFEDKLESGKKQDQKLRLTWNRYVDALFEEDTLLQNFLEHFFTRNKCVTSFSSAAILPITLLSSSNIPTGSTFMENALPLVESKLQLLPSLSDLELSLLIAAARLDIILDTDVCDFPMVYDEYVQLASRVKVQSSAAGQTAVGSGARVWGKEVALGAWEKLTELDLVVPAGTGIRAMWRVDVALEEIVPSLPRMGATVAKWCKEI
ncbi:MAG: hypothetical protein Q9218_005958 [Villophora microphyllina]